MLFVSVILRQLSALTPALSPRRGSAQINLTRARMPLSAVVASLDKSVRGLHDHSHKTRRVMLPLLGVRAKLLSIAVMLFACFRTAHAQEKVTYSDHVLPLVEQHCAKCHNPDKKKGDLDLTSYSGALKGGGSGVVVVSGNPDSSKLMKALTHAEEPNMPPNKPPLPEKELVVFKRWIAGGLLETSGSKAIA